MLESVTEFMERRRREIEKLTRGGTAAVHEAYGKTTRAGERLILRTADEVAQYGARLIGDKRPAPPQPQSSSQKTSATQDFRPATAKTPQRVPPASAAGQRKGGGRDPNDAVRVIGNRLASTAGNAAGLVTGAANAAEGLLDGAIFASRLADPLDRWKSPPGQSAASQLARAGLGVVSYVGRGIADPSIIARDARSKAHQMRLDLDPRATPPASTFSGEVMRNFTVGKNQGELTFDVISLGFGGPFAKAANKIGAASRSAVGAEKYLAQGFSPPGAAYLATPYSGMGHHNVPRRYRLPKALGSGPLPPAINDGPFNVLHPEGITRGDFYSLHNQVDRYFRGTKLPARFGGESWSGKRLGLERYELPERLWHGTPAQLKARIGGSAAVGGGLIYDLGEEER